MKFYSILYIALYSLAVFQVHAMERQLIPIIGRISIVGPVAYGPKQYYDYLSEFGIKTQLHEPLIKVSVEIDDKHYDGYDTVSRWTLNGNPYLFNIPSEEALVTPRIIRKSEKKYYKQTYGTDSIPSNVAYKINNAFFPSYLPVSVFKDFPVNVFKDFAKKYTLNLTVFRYIVTLEIVRGTSLLEQENHNKAFKNIFTAQLKKFIKAPRYFKWRKEDAGSSIMYNPIRELMNALLIKKRALPEKTKDLMTMCHKFQDLCSDYCSADPNMYEHGIKGIYKVEKLESQFGLFFCPGILIGDPELVLKMIEMRDKRREAAKEEK